MKHGVRTSREAIALAERVLSRVMGEFDVPAHAGAILTGSLAEGVGNGYSDIDIEILDPNSNSDGIGRHYSAFGRQRVEVFFRSPRDLEQLARRVNHCDSPEGPSLMTLKQYHNFCYGYPIRNRSVVQAATAAFDADAVSRVSARVFARRAAREIGLARAMLEFDRPREALAPLLEAAQSAATSWAAAHGETFLGRSCKWLSILLARAGLSAGHLERYTAYMHRTPEQEPRQMLDSCRALFALFETEQHCFDDEIRVAALPGTTQHVSGSCIVLSRPGLGEREVCVLGERASEVWRSLSDDADATGDRPLATFAHRAEVGALHLHGLVSVSVGGALARHVEERISQPRRDARVGTSGVQEDANLPVTRIACSAKAFERYRDQTLRAQRQLVQARADVVGASKASLWSVVERSLSRAVTAAASAVLATHRASTHAASGAEGLELLGQLPQSALLEARRLERLEITSDAEASAALRALDAWLRCLPLDL